MQKYSSRKKREKNQFLDCTFPENSCSQMGSKYNHPPKRIERQKSRKQQVKTYQQPTVETSANGVV